MKGTLSLEEAEKFARDSLRLLGPIVESYAGEIPVYDIRMKEVYENDNEELHRNLQEIGRAHV